MRCVSAPPYGTGLPVVTPVTLPPRAQSAPPIVPEARSCNGYVELSNGKQIWDELELKGLATKNPAVWPQKTLCECCANAMAVHFLSLTHIAPNHCSRRRSGRSRGQEHTAVYRKTIAPEV